MKFKLIQFFLILTTLASAVVSAHPGRTASDGCHYCRTNCDQWGVPWNVRHCHGTSHSSFRNISATIETTEGVEPSQSSFKSFIPHVPEVIIPSR